MNNRISIRDSVIPLLHAVTRPARYVGGELNMIRKNPDTQKLSVCLAFPDIYDIGQSYIGFHILYHILNQKSGINCERTFAPWPDMEETMRSKGVPLWSVENFLPVASFDVVGFTLQYELHYTAILNMLDLAGIPLRSHERSDADPIILGGGTCVVNPEPVADYFDAFLLGDGEEAFPEILDAIIKTKNNGAPRAGILSRLAEIEGVYIPSLYRPTIGPDGSFAGMEPQVPEARIPVTSRVVNELKPDHYPERPLVPLCEVVHDRLAVEIMRGCTHGCRFCSAGMSYRPNRFRPVNDVVNHVVKGIQTTGWDEVSLVSLSTTDFPGLEAVVDKIGARLKDKAVSISLSSLRADNFSLKMAEATAGGRKTSLTFAVEAGSQRLRDVINKNLTEEQLFETITTAMEHGFGSIKLYFMIGLPSETDEDILAIADLLSRIGKLARNYKGRAINVTVSPFSPKPQTPFQWEAQDSLELLRKKLALISEHLRSRSINIRESNPFLSLLECRIARGGRELAPIIHEAWKRGSRLDAWSECINQTLWTEVFKEAGIDVTEGGGGLEPGSPLPWSHLHYGVDEHYLLKEREKAQRAETTADCREHCSACGPYASFCSSLKRQTDKNETSEGAQKTGAADQAGLYGRKRKPVQGHQQAGLQGTRLRIKYGKSGTNRFTSHLDMVRIFDRTLRRAGIPIAYSQGFHPHPKISFGHPLPLGMGSRAEYADIILNEPFPAIDGAFRRGFPDGFDLVDIRPIGDKARSLTQIVSLSEYFVKCDVDETIASVIAEILARESIPTERTSKKGIRTVDIRRGIESIAIADDRSGFTMLLSVDSESAVKPYEVTELIFPGVHVHDITRTEQYASINGDLISPLNVMW